MYLPSFYTVSCFPGPYESMFNSVCDLKAFVSVCLLRCISILMVDVVCECVFDGDVATSHQDLCFFPYSIFLVPG